MCIFAQKPTKINSRYDSIFAACQQGRLKTKELEQYFRAMITEREEQSIASFHKEERKQEGIELERKKNISNLLTFGMSPEDISKALSIPLETVLAIKG